MQESNIPKHVALIPDGNRRWAKERGLPQFEGHAAGFRKFLDFVEWCQKRKVKVVTTFGFSTENWNRPAQEVSYLLSLFERGLIDRFRKYKEQEEEQRKGVRVRVIGEKKRFPASLQRIIEEVEQGTKENTILTVNIALSYGGRWDIVQAVQQLLREKVSAEELTEDAFGKRLSTAGLPDVDLLIRTSGEQRVSNFVLWQMAYAELYFYPKHWPDFTEHDLDAALAGYSRRSRRFGH